MKILCIDGGGLRGIIPLILLKEIEEITGKKIFELFDVVAGTSTGALVAAGILVTEDGFYPNKSIDDVIELYDSLGSNIFNRPFYKIHRKIPFFFSRYKHKSLIENVNKFFNNKRLGDISSKTEFIACSLDLRNHSNIIFSSKNYNNDEFSREKVNFKLSNICLSSAAAPTYFPSYVFTERVNKNLKPRYNCVDGGVYANNPSLVALTEVLKANYANYYENTEAYNWESNKIDIEKIKVLSIGTGEFNDGTEKRQKGGIDFVKRVKGYFEASSRMVDMQMNALMNDKYLRLNVNIKKSKSDMDKVKYYNYWKNEAIIKSKNKNFNLLIKDFFSN